MELVQQLKQDGITKGLCQAWQGKLKDGLSIKRLIELYIRGIDFCISNDYPTLDFIREHFKGKCELYGVYVDDRNVDVRDLPDVVLEGDCKGVLSYGGYSVSRAFIRHNSDVIIKVYANAHLTVDVFDDVSLDMCVAGNNARVLINIYGNAKVRCSGNGVKVVNKNKKTY